LIKKNTQHKGVPIKNPEAAGYINDNNQMCLGTRGKPGTDHLQYSYRMICLEEDCEFIYGANGTDVHERKCPRCQKGAPEIPY